MPITNAQCVCPPIKKSSTYHHKRAFVKKSCHEMRIPTRAFTDYLLFIDILSLWLRKKKLPTMRRPQTILNAIINHHHWLMTRRSLESLFLLKKTSFTLSVKWIQHFDKRSDEQWEASSKPERTDARAEQLLCNKSRCEEGKISFNGS